MRRTQIAVIGFGNPMRGDDAVGLEVARRVGQAKHPYIQAVEVVSDGMNLVAAWDGCETAIVLDAMVTGLEPGSIRRLSATEVLRGESCPFPSTHGIGLLEALHLAQALNRLPRRLVVVGIEGSRFDVGEQMSSEVLAAIEPAVEQVLREARLAALSRPAPLVADDPPPAEKVCRDA